MIATPAYGGMVSNIYMQSVMALMLACMQTKIGFRFLSHGNESLITRGRNRMVSEFLKTDYTHLMFIDADIGFNAQDVLTMLGKDKEIICGAYAKKTINWQRIHAAVKDGVPPEDLAVHAAEHAVNFVSDKIQLVDDICEIHDGATGFMIIKREVFERLACKELMYLSDTKGDFRQPMFAFFDCGIDAEDRYLSEDYYFCRLWQNTGGKVWLYPKAKLLHMGAYGFEGDPMSCFMPA